MIFLNSRRGYVSRYTHCHEADLYIRLSRNYNCAIEGDFEDAVTVLKGCM